MRGSYDLKVADCALGVNSGEAAASCQLVGTGWVVVKGAHGKLPEGFDAISDCLGEGREGDIRRRA